MSISTCRECGDRFNTEGEVRELCAECVLERRRIGMPKPATTSVPAGPFIIINGRRVRPCATLRRTEIRVVRGKR